MCYWFKKIKWFLLSFCLLTIPCFLHKISSFLCQYSPSWVQCFPVTSCVLASVGWFHQSSVCGIRMLRDWEREGGKCEVGRETKDFCTGVRETIMERDLLRQSHGQTWFPFGSLYHRGLGRQVSQIMHEYDHATAIEIRPLIQPRTCNMGSSIFPDMVRLKFVSITRASSLSMPSKEITNEKNIYITNI